MKISKKVTMLLKKLEVAMTFLRKVAITFFGKSNGSDYKKNVANPTSIYIAKYLV